MQVKSDGITRCRHCGPRVKEVLNSIRILHFQSDSGQVHNPRLSFLFCVSAHPCLCLFFFFFLPLALSLGSPVSATFGSEIHLGGLSWFSVIYRVIILFLG